MVFELKYTEVDEIPQGILPTVKRFCSSRIRKFHHISICIQAIGNIVMKYKNTGILMKQKAGWNQQNQK